MRIFKSRWFDRYARKEGISDDFLLDAVARAERGQIDADLGGEVIKQRIARPGEGRSKGYRTIILYRRGTKAFIQFGFAKRERANITQQDEREFKKAARYILTLPEKPLDELVRQGEFVEVKANE